MDGLIRRISGLAPFKELVKALDREVSSLRVGSVFGAAEAAVVAALIKHLDYKVLLVAPDTEIQREYLDDFGAFGVDVSLFPQLLEKVERRMNAALQRDRLRVLTDLKDGRVRIVVATLHSVFQRVPPPERLKEEVLTVRAGEGIEVDSLVRRLLDAGYESVDFVGAPGEFAQRGGIVDVYPFDSSVPYRLEFFGDEVESIRIFDEATQRTERMVQMVEVLLRGADEDGEGSVLDYFSDGLLIISGRVSPESTQLLAEAERRRIRPLLFSPTPVVRDGSGLDFPFLPARRIGADAEGVVSYIADCIKRDGKVYLFCPTEGDRKRLEELCGEFGVSFDRIDAEIALISGGFVVEGKFAVLSYIQLFGKKRLPYEVEAEAPVAAPGIEMVPGDLCVHSDYGICRFRGVEMIETEGVTEEMLCFEFADGAKVFISPLQVEKVHRYIGAGRVSPALSRLGERVWMRRKERVRRAVGELARQLLLIQAKRMLHKGIAFPPDSTLLKEFEAAFPYTETEDQKKAARSVQDAMTQPRPMDYLLAGDVGYGKTEVAMRAAFKAVEFGKQVAVLVPTTLLAEQHYRTFTQRMADYPIIIECLSRFRRASEQADILERLADGRIDIVIGTHRLLSRDVKFYDLGLLIIDEEQRFGVEQKEHFKRLRTSIDVLSLTATPIPRTLNMALSGIKDMAILATPPPQKLAVVTKVARYDKRLIRDAILRELARGGQVFFVHNRVKTIDAVCAELQGLVPEARFGITHGRMEEDELAETMANFLDRKLDVLVTTTIIESGLDIPSVNTLLVNNAHTFGLADLHQLRGRVGRHAEQAFAYFLVPSFKKIKHSARQRLRAIEEFDRLGAGFQIALRDLEIRGAGNILGKEQSGLIHAVGYDLYIRLLSDTIAELRGQPHKERLPVELDIPLEAFIPSDYIKDMRQKIEFYREIASADSASALKEVARKMEDIFGKPPDVVRNLLLKSELAILLGEFGIEYIGVRKEGCLLRYRTLSGVRRLLEDGENFWTAGKNTLYARIPKRLRSDPLALVRFLIRRLTRLLGG